MIPWPSRCFWNDRNSPHPTIKGIAVIGELLCLAQQSLPPKRLAAELERLALQAASPEQADRQLVARVEDEVSKAPDRVFRFDEHGFATLRAAGHEWGAGRFETPSIGDLRARAAAQPTAPGGGMGRCRLFILRGGTALTDIGALEAFDDGDTLFQVASQFNCLEAPSPRIVPIVDYFDDWTQGPRASIAAFPGTFLRHYRAPDSSGNRFVQSNAGPQIDLLHDTCSPGVACVQGGYVTAQQVNESDRLAGELQERFPKIRVGVHEVVEVVLGHNWNGPVANPHPRIAQVFTSTLAAGGYSSGLTLESEGPWRTVARQLLRAAYLGTLLAAKTLHKRRVVLTLIGGGVFGNPHDLICEALSMALEEAEQVGDSLDVIVNTYRSPAGPFLPVLEARGGWMIDVDRPEAHQHVVCDAIHSSEM